MGTGAKKAAVRRRAGTSRRKLSTTISDQSFRYLENLVTTRKAYSLAEAVDVAIQRLRQAENRARLEADTAAYFANRSDEEVAEDKALEDHLSEALQSVDFDA